MSPPDGPQVHTLAAASADLLHRLVDMAGPACSVPADIEEKENISQLSIFNLKD